MSSEELTAIQRLEREYPRPGPPLAARRLQVLRVLSASPGLSDRKIAEMCYVSRELVAQARKRLVERCAIPRVEKRVGRDKKEYKIRGAP